MPRVSVVVPAKDAASSIGRAVGSVVAQDFSDWEVVVCDDGSSDDTAARVEAAGDPRVRVVRRERPGGPAAARNAALAQASGELVAFLDADDELLPGFLSTQVARLDRERAAPGPPVGLLACDAHVVEPGGAAPHRYLEQFHEAVEPLTLERVLRRNCVYIAAVVPREVGEEVGWFAEELFGTEDHDLWIRILETGRRAVLTREPLARYHRSAGSVSSNLASQGANNQRTYARALARGRLSPAGVRIARRELRYNRAMEAAARAWFGRDLRAGLRAAPVLAGVALERPGHWADWARELRRR